MHKRIWAFTLGEAQWKMGRTSRSTVLRERKARLMAMIAYAFLQHLRLAAASGGKKNRPRPASADAAGHTKSRRRRPGACCALPMPALPPASPQIAQLKCQSSARLSCHSVAGDV